MFMYDMPKALKTPNKKTTCPPASNPQHPTPPPQTHQKQHHNPNLLCVSPNKP